MLAGAAGVSAGALAGCFPDVGGRWPEVTELCVDTGDPSPLAGSSPVVEVFRQDSVLVDPDTQRAQIQEAPVALAEGGDGRVEFGISN